MEENSVDVVEEEVKDEQDVEESKVIVVGESEYPLIKTGRAQADQVAGLARWIKVFGMPATQDMSAGSVDEKVTGIQLILNLVGGLTGDALIDLYEVVTGCTKPEAETYFDVAQLIDVAIATYESQPSFQKLLDRFLPGFSSPTPSETSVDESSMISEKPTDG